MKQSLEQLISEATEPGHRKRILAQGLARGLIWKDGIVPEGGPNFPEELSDDLFDYGYSLLSVCLQYKKKFGINDLCKKGLLSAGEAIESVVRKGSHDNERGFHIVSAAMSYHLAGYSARAFCMVNEPADALNLSKIEMLLLLFLRRDFSAFRLEIERSINDITTQDSALEDRVSKTHDAEVDEHELLSIALENNLLRAVSWFEYAIKTGSKEAVHKFEGLIKNGLEITNDAGNASLSWQYRLTCEIFHEVWERTFHEVLPSVIFDEEWQRQKRLFISSLYSRSPSEIDLWPSQVEAAKRSYDMADDLVVTMPTSSGKTRVAELCILRCLSEGKRVIYVTPLRALSAQSEKILIKTFGPLGYSVSNLYGSAGSTSIDIDSLLNRRIVVSTPEKLDFALRGNSEILDDVGLVVLDEGHMIGLGEREIRYEILIQRLLKRTDSESRRIVCLSAILPEGDQLDSLVAWIRQDVEGAPVKSFWKPNRQRVGVIQWMGSHCKLDFRQSAEKPFIPRFVESEKPRKQRRKNFPKNKNEMVLASAWKLAKDQHRVLIYCPLRLSVEPLAKLAMQVSKQGYLPSLLEDIESINSAVKIGNEWLGNGHIAVQCLKLGIAVHHGQLPRAFQSAVEDLINRKICKVIISSPTLAQGLNISASALLINSIYRNKKVIPQSEFANVVGRSGRAFVDIDGLVLFPVFVEPSEDDENQTLLKKELRSWDRYIASMSARQLTSGLLLLVKAIADSIKRGTGTSADSLLEYVMNSKTVWSCPETLATSSAESGQEDPQIPWDKHLAFLDTAVLSLADDLSCDPSTLAAQLDTVLNGSLWQRHLLKVAVEDQMIYKSLLVRRAKHIWGSTSVTERRAYFAAGLGLATGKEIGSNNDLKTFLNEAEQLVDSDVTTCIENLCKIASYVFQFREFKPSNICEKWSEVLAGWLSGEQMSKLIEIGGEHTVQFISEGLCYKLVWAIEAIRVSKLDDKGDFELKQFENEGNFLAIALESGSLNRSACLLLQSGLSSRKAAHLAVELGNATFKRRGAMWGWLFSTTIRRHSQEFDWPSEDTGSEWQKFYNFSRSESFKKLIEKNWVTTCNWESPVDDVNVFRIEQGSKTARVLSPDYQFVGTIIDWIPLPNEGNLWAKRIDNDLLHVTYIGPDVVSDVVVHDGEHGT